MNLPFSLHQRALQAAASKASRGRALIGIGMLFMAACAQADCIDDAAAHHGVSSPILRAIGWFESRLKPWSVNTANRNGSVDVGAFMINSAHFPELARWGVSQKDLMDGCVASYVGAWMYKKCINDLGDSWQAVGCYHSRTEGRVHWYADEVFKVLQKWRVVADQRTPFDGAFKLSPAAVNPPGAARVRAPQVQVAASEQVSSTPIGVSTAADRPVATQANAAAMSRVSSALSRGKATGALPATTGPALDMTEEPQVALGGSHNEPQDEQSQ